MKAFGYVLIFTGGALIAVAPDTIMDLTFWIRTAGMVVLMVGCFATWND